MLDRDLAQALRNAGLDWTPAQGDAFLVPDRDLDEMVFVLSDMVVELQRLPRIGEVLAFNGTTEWALDSLEAAEALWLPREEQLRERIGDRLVSLERLSGPATGYAVTVCGSGPAPVPGADAETVRYVDVTAEAAYARALLALLTAPPPVDPQ